MTIMKTNADIFCVCVSIRSNLVQNLHQVSLSIIHPATIGHPPSTEIGVLNMSSLKAKKPRKLPQAKYS